MDAAAQENVRELDPFGFWIGHGSAIRPLGGEERGPDPRYVFHTPYVEFNAGRILFTVRFEGLQASFGVLRVFINAFVPGSNRDAVFVTSSRLDLTDRLAVERGVTISILSVAGATYAVHGVCWEGTDARASGLTVTAEESEAEGLDSGTFLLPTTHGNAPLDLSARLVADEAPSFRDPISQAMTEQQLDETEFQQWNARLSGAIADNRSRWRFAFIAQVLNRYGMLRSGARGVTLGGGGIALGPILAAAGCQATVGQLPANHGASDFVWSNVICRQLDAAGMVDGPGAAIEFADQPAATRGFDFMWTLGMAQLGYEAGHSANFLFELMTVLRPGGFAVHLMDVAPREGEAGSLPRAEVERLAVTLISRGFTVAQLNFIGLAGAQASVPFGLIVRKD